jgi:Dyp-type peroxidase family
MVVNEEAERQLEDHLASIQGNILHGYRSARAAYVFYAAPDAVQAQAFLGQLALQVETAVRVRQPRGPEMRTVVNVALTYAGLRALGVDAAILDQLPQAFTQPMAQRAELLDDRGPSEPARWDAGLGAGRAHILVMLNQVIDPHHEYASEAEGREAVAEQRLAFEGDRARLSALAAGYGMEEVHAQLAELLSSRREHFGWADGLSQPAIAGALGSNSTAVGGSPQAQPDESPDGWRPIAAGELLHGYLDEDGLITSGATAPLLLDGTFMVYRKLFQDIVSFRDQLQADANAYRDHLGLEIDDQNAYEYMAAKVVGRWRDGKAISLFPDPREVGNLGGEEDESPSNDFRYWPDRSGAVCPLGAHIRRTNPRDALGWKGAGEMSERHRIVRRGMPYGPFRPWDPTSPTNTDPDGVDRGLIFICFNADIERQFEVVQRQWCNDGNLFGVADEKDYLLGDHLPDDVCPDGRARATHITIQGGPDRPPHLVPTRAPVVWTKGCEYLLVPGLDALRALAGGVFGAPADPPEETDDIARVVELAKADLARMYPPGTTPVGRDQHPRAHGLVRARLEVAPDLPQALRAGVFAEAGRTYDAWIRFSSRAGGPTATDEKRDAHGMAIKLFGVEGPKVLAADADATTQDFVLANSPTFLCRNAHDYVELATKSANGKLVSFFLGADPRRWRIRALLNLVRAITQRVDSPLDIRYWSQTSSRLGDRAVKYSAAPVAHARADRRAKGRNRIGDTMASQLAQAGATFHFMVQLQGDPVAMPIDDPTVRWDEDVSAFETVATIHIPKQAFRSERRRHLAEHLSFTPWHTLHAHRPLGSINRVRRAVYDAISDERHRRNDEPRTEPGHLEDC